MSIKILCAEIFLIMIKKNFAPHGPLRCNLKILNIIHQLSTFEATFFSLEEHRALWKPCCHYWSAPKGRALRMRKRHWLKSLSCEKEMCIMRKELIKKKCHQVKDCLSGCLLWGDFLGFLALGPNLNFWCLCRRVTM